MKKVTLLAVLALASTAWAQDDKKEEAKPAAQVEQTAPSKPAATATKIRFTHRRFQDARHCLDKGDNTEIIKCAEAYL